MKSWQKALIGLGAAAAAAWATRRARPGVRVVAPGAAFAAPWVLDATYRGIRGPSCVLGAVFDTHGAPSRNRAVAQAMAGEQVDGWLHAGDVADGDADPGLYVSQWDRVFGALTPIYAVSGNHDSQPGFSTRFGRLPRVVHLPGVDVYLLPWGWGRSTVAWLGRELEESKAPNRVLVVHQPLWTGDGGRRGAKALGDLLRKIDLVVAGHEHVVRDDTYDVSGHRVRQFVGLTGPKEYRCPETARPNCLERSHGYLLITVWPDHLTLRWRPVDT